jgi:hypothetical protein
MDDEAGLYHDRLTNVECLINRLARRLRLLEDSLRSTQAAVELAHGTDSPTVAEYNAFRPIGTPRA